VAILRSKADRAGYHIPGETIEFIARRVQSNIRELEGALTRVAAFASLSGLPVTPQLVDSALADLLPRRSEVHLDNVLGSVAEVFGVTVDRLLGRDRSQKWPCPPDCHVSTA